MARWLRGLDVAPILRPDVSTMLSAANGNYGRPKSKGFYSFIPRPVSLRAQFATSKGNLGNSWGFEIDW